VDAARGLSKAFPWRAPSSTLAPAPHQGSLHIVEKKTRIIVTLPASFPQGLLRFLSMRSRHHEPAHAKRPANP